MKLGEMTYGLCKVPQQMRSIGQATLIMLGLEPWRHCVAMCVAIGVWLCIDACVGVGIRKCVHWRVVGPVGPGHPQHLKPRYPEERDLQQEFPDDHGHWP